MIDTEVNTNIGIITVRMDIHKKLSFYLKNILTESNAVVLNLPNIVTL